MLFWDLGDLQQSQMVRVSNKSASLYIGFGLVGYFHDECRPFPFFRIDKIVQNIQIHGSTQIVHIRNEAVVTAFCQEFLKQSRIIEWLVEISMTGWIPTEIKWRKTDLELYIGKKGKCKF